MLEMLYLLWDGCVHERPHSLGGSEQVLLLGSVHSGALHYLFQDKIMLVAPTNVLIFLHSSDLVDFSNWKKGSIGVCVPIESLVELRAGMSV